MIFFSGEGNGLTSTSANHIANLAKEMIREIESSLSALTFYSTTVGLIGTRGGNTLALGDDIGALEAVPAGLHKIARAHSLIAWLREAIKAKERMLKEIAELSFPDYLKIRGLEQPETPVMEPPLTDDSYYASLSINERNSYYSLEALASVIGKAVHPDGSLSRAREDLNLRIRKPKDIDGKGRDTLIYKYTATVEPEQVDEVFFRLQKQFRETQARLNAIKFECAKAVKESEIACQANYAEALARYNAVMSQLRADMAAYIKTRSREIGNYKIVIPDSLKQIFSEVSELGKKNKV